MNYQFQLINWILLGTTLISVLVAIFAWQKRGRLVARYLFLLTSGAAVWSFTYFFETAATELSHILIWAQISYIGISTVPLFYFLLALAYGQHYKYLIGRNFILLSIVPLFTLLMVATNHWHNLFYTSVSIDPASNMAIYGYSIWFWIYAMYSYVLLVIGLVIMLRAILSVPKIYRFQIFTLIIGAILPFTGNFIYIFKINPMPGMDWTPIAFGLSGLFLMWGIFEFQLLNLIPLARHKLIETMQSGVLVIDARGFILDYNPAMQVITGIPAKNAIGLDVIKVLAFWKEFIACYDTKTDKREEICLKKGKAISCYDLQITVLYDRRDQPAGQVILFRDITDQKQTEDILRQSEEQYRSLSTELAESNSMKELLLDVIAHDLKNPVWAIRSYAEMAVKNDPKNLILEEIRLSTDNLLDMIGNATALSKITFGEPIEKEKLDITTIINVVIKEFSALLLDYGISLEMKISEEIITTANPIIAEVFRNYIGNATKYAKTGKKIIIDAELDDDHITINVKDFGKTIAKKDREKIFMRKFQLNISKGLGLGLSIVKRIANAHDATVGVTPNKPKGNIFYIILER